MKYIIIFILSLIGCLLLIPNSNAGCSTARCTTTYYPTVTTPTVVTPVIYFPLYEFRYNAQEDLNQLTAIVDRLIQARMLIMLQQLQDTKEEFPTAPGLNPNIQNTSLNIKSLTNNCFSCHNSQVSKGQVILFDKNNNFNPNVTAKEIVDAVSSRRMPPNRQLNPEDTRSILNFLGVK